MRVLAAMILGMLSVTCGSDDSSEVDPASLEKVQQEFDAFEIERFSLHQKRDRLDDCLIATWWLSHTTSEEHFNFSALLGNVCSRSLSFVIPTSHHDATILFSYHGSTSKWCGTEWEWSGKWHQVTVEPGETVQVGSLLSFRGIEAIGTDEFSVQIAWPRPGDRPEEYCKYNQSTHYVRTYLPNLSEIETAPLVEHLRQESP